MKARQGIKYEAKVHDHFEARYGLRYFPGQWWSYAESGDDIRYCQTDGILIDEACKRIVLLEVKLSHTPAAYWQMENLYLPVLQRFFRTGNWSFITVEVVKWYDCAVACPRRPVLRERIEDAKPGEFAVHIWN